MSEKFVKLCTCRACNNVYIDTDSTESSKSYPAEVVKKFKIKPLANGDCPNCKSGESELVKNLDVLLKLPRKVNNYLSKFNY